MWLLSRKLGLIGQADVVEIDASGDVTPVEYKRGRPKRDDSDRVQLCAQAMCLEDQFQRRIKHGYLFYGKRKRRSEVALDTNLRNRTIDLVSQVRKMIRTQTTPPAVRLPKCDKCSLIEFCLPDAGRFKTNAAAWNQRQYSGVLSDIAPQTDHDDSL